MTTPQTKKRTTLVQRTAFTLVELMVVILVIGILAGIAAPFIFGALERAREFSIQNEIGQLDAAVRRFETENGFFPPAIGPGLEIDTTDSDAGRRAFLRYLNRIAPNHAEGVGNTGAGNAPDGLRAWWDTVGVNLDAESSLVFWLSGLCTSKQYPLSGNASNENSDVVLAPYNVNKDAADDDLASGVNIDRSVFFDFDLGRLVTNGSVAGIKSYNQPQGKDDALAYQYLDSKSYSSSPGAYHIAEGSSEPVFFNPESFQIICPGMDGVISSEDEEMRETNLIDETGVDSAQDDNITNFSDGRLERSYGG